jgi:hypothetical protein
MHFPPFFSSGGALRIYEALDPLLLETNQLIVDRAGGVGAPGAQRAAFARPASLPCNAQYLSNAEFL